MPRSAGRIGWFLVWAVVFCDIGTSVYYVPGILYQSTQDRAGVFVVATMLAFVLLAEKVVEITRRFTGGGGVVSLADAAFGPWWGCLGGQLIMVDYFLTVAISAVSGVYYIDSVFPLGGAVLPVTVVALAVLFFLNVVGIKESARASSVLAVAALVTNLAVIVTALAHAPPDAGARMLEVLRSTRELTPWQALVGYSGAWLAFSGLESLSQLSPAMRELDATPRRGMIAVVVTVILTAPALTFLSTLALSPEVKSAETERFVSELAGTWGGAGLKLATVLTASTLLLFAANTAIIGNYHVQLALQRRRFLPDALGELSPRFQTPWRAILLSTLVPILVVVAVRGDMATLGELYAFGLLGCFVLNSLGIDVLRWRDGERGPRFWLGIVTSVAVLVAFGVNLVAKPGATLFGGALTALGMALAWGTRSGAVERVAGRLPLLRAPRTECPDLAVNTLEAAVAARSTSRPGLLVACRGVSEGLIREAAERAHARGDAEVFLVYVDEVPGLFYPPHIRASDEALRVLAGNSAALEKLGVTPSRVWTLSHSAAGSVAEAAVSLGCDTVFIGATRRTLLWQAIRGRFIQDLLRHLPSSIRLIVVH